jgi:hypothetical protein
VSRAKASVLTVLNATQQQANVRAKVAAVAAVALTGLFLIL